MNPPEEMRIGEAIVRLEYPNSDDRSAMLSVEMFANDKLYRRRKRFTAAEVADNHPSLQGVALALRAELLVIIRRDEEDLELNLTP